MLDGLKRVAKKTIQGFYDIRARRSRRGLCQAVDADGNTKTVAKGSTIKFFGVESCAIGTYTVHGAWWSWLRGHQRECAVYVRAQSCALGRYYTVHGAWWSWLGGRQREYAVYVRTQSVKKTTVRAPRVREIAAQVVEASGAARTLVSRAHQQ